MTIPADSTQAVARTGVALRDPLPWSQLLQVVETAEETGYEAVFVPEIAGREAFSTLTGFAATTRTIRLGTGVVTMWARSPATTAMAAATVHDLSEGRLVLGVGAGFARGTAAASLTATGGVIRLMRRYVEAVREALQGRPVGSADGEDPFGVEGFSLGLPLPMGPPPIWLAALGDRMISLAGEIADGVLLNWCTPERVAEARDLVSKSAEGAGRDRRRFTIAVYVRACLGVEEAVAIEALKEMTGQYASIPHYRRQMERMGLGEEAAIAAKALQAGRVEEVPEPLVRALTVVGGRHEVLGRFHAYRAAGANLVLCYPVGALDPFSSILGTVVAASPNPAVER